MPRKFSFKPKFNTMKKSLLYYCLFLLAIVFTSCTGDDETVDPAPTITIPNTAPTTAQVGTTIRFDVAVVAKSKIKSIEVRKDNLAINTKTSGFTNSDSDTYPFSYTVTAADAGKKLAFTMVVTDTKGKTASADYSVTVGAAAAFGTTNASVSLLAQTATTPLPTAPGSFFSTIDNRVYNTADANTNASKVDISYGVLPSGSAALISPDARATAGVGGIVTGGTATRFAAAPAGMTYDAATAADIAAIADATFTASVQPIMQGSSYIFRNANGKKGIIKVNTITTAGTSPNVNLSIKVLQ